VGKKANQHSLRIHSLLIPTAQLPYSSFQSQHFPDPSMFLISLPYYRFLPSLLNYHLQSSTTLDNVQAKNRELVLCLVQLRIHWLPVLRQKG